MPIYEYRCAACGKRFEVLVASARQAASACGECGSASIERLPSRFALRGATSGATAREAGGGCCGGGCGCGDRSAE